MWFLRGAILPFPEVPWQAAFSGALPGRSQDIVCPNTPGSLNAGGSINVKNSTSAARDPFPHALPERSHPSHCLPETSHRLEAGRVKQCEKWHLRRTRLVSARAGDNQCRQAPSLKPDCGAAVPAAMWVGIPISEFRIPN